MPVCKNGQTPRWAELESYEIVKLSPGDTHIFERVGMKEKLIVAAGQCRVTYDNQTVTADEGTNLDLWNPGEQFEVVEVLADTCLVRMCGHWGSDTGGSGLFRVKASDEPHDNGDPVDYPKATNFDSHYHDCDEYWILLEGRGVAVTEGKPYEVGPGDCVATGMGHHHDFPQVFEPVKAVYFETTLEGLKRLGHLWNHTHNQAQPKPYRA